MAVIRFKCVNCNKEILKHEKNRLTCYNCGISYSIKDNVYDFTSSGMSSDINKKNAHNWGYQWKSLEEKDLKKINNYTNENSFFRFNIIEKKEIKDKTILVLGCGNGKEIMHLLNYSPKLIVAVDISSSIYFASKRTKSEKVIFIKADITNLPIKKKFDIIIADRVFHHIENWTLPFFIAFSMLNKKGVLACNMYSEENNHLLKDIVFPLRKILFSKLSLPVLYYSSFLLGLFIYPLIKLFAVLYKLGFNFQMGKTILFWEGFGFTYFWRSTIFDLLHAPIMHLVSKKKLIEFAAKVGFKNIKTQIPTGTLWCFRGMRLE